MRLFEITYPNQNIKWNKYECRNKIRTITEIYNTNHFLFFFSFSSLLSSKVKSHLGSLLNKFKYFLSSVDTRTSFLSYYGIGLSTSLPYLSWDGDLLLLNNYSYWQWSFNQDYISLGIKGFIITLEFCTSLRN